jgi:hypothetical protein
VNIHTTSADTATNKWIIQWGEDSNGQLLFAAFNGFPPQTEKVSGLVTTVSSSDAQPYGLVNTGHGEIRVPGTLKLFEQVNGVYRESKQIVTLSQFQAFRYSNPPEYTIEALLRFAAKGGEVQAKEATTKPVEHPGSGAD